jgi:hypothetical protein
MQMAGGVQVMYDGCIVVTGTCLTMTTGTVVTVVVTGTVLTGWNAGAAAAVTDPTTRRVSMRITGITFMIE